MNWLKRSVCGLLLSVLACAAPGSTPRESDADGDLTGRVQRVQIGSDDTLVELAREHDLGYSELVAANPGVDPWVPGAREILLPTAFLMPDAPREGIVVNLAEQRLFLFRGGKVDQSFPIGVSRDGWSTPTGATKVVRKVKGPTWYPGPTARADDPSLGRSVPPGPENPLGTHALYLGWPAYLIHGTNKPYGIGRRVSRGCIRLYPEDIVELYDLVQVGDPVRVVNQPVKLGWFQGDLYLEAHPTLEQLSQMEQSGEFDPSPPPELRERVLRAAGASAGRLDWEAVDRALELRNGTPMRITRKPSSGGFAAVRRVLAGWLGAGDGLPAVGSER